jgi:hypothetical protein
MKKIILIVFCLFFMSPMFAQQNINKNTIAPPIKREKGRYNIYMSEDGIGAILLDTATGISWRKVYCQSDKPENKVPGCWELMDYILVSPYDTKILSY